MHANAVTKLARRKSQMAPRTVAEIVAIVLERISEWRFGEREGEGGEEIVIPVYEPKASEDAGMNISLRMLWEELQNSPEAKAFSGDLREHWSDFWTLELLKRSPLLKRPEELMPLLKGKSYEEVLQCVRQQNLDLLADVERSLATGRETLQKLIGESSLAKGYDESFE